MIPRLELRQAWPKRKPILGLLLRDPKTDFGGGSGRRKPEENRFEGCCKSRVLRNKSFIMMLFGKVFIFFSTAVPYLYIPDLLVDQGDLTSAQASLALTTLGTEDCV